MRYCSVIYVFMLLVLSGEKKLLGDTFPTQSQVLVENFEFTGNTIFTDEELLEIAAPYLQEAIVLEKLLELKK